MREFEKSDGRRPGAFSFRPSLPSIYVLREIIPVDVRLVHEAAGLGLSNFPGFLGSDLRVVWVPSLDQLFDEGVESIEYS